MSAETAGERQRGPVEVSGTVTAEDPGTAVYEVALYTSSHGGIRNPSSRGSVAGGYDHSALVRVMGEDGRWPDLAVVGEGDYHEFFGGLGMYGAAKAMRRAGGRAYVPLPCSLPREWGPFAPTYFYDAETFMVEQFFYHGAPDFAARNRNVVILETVKGGRKLLVCTGHGDLNSAVYREADAEAMRWLANAAHLAIIAADFNETLSGPRHEATDVEQRSRTEKSWRMIHRLRKRSGRVLRPARRTTGALDFLCGAWNPRTGQREDGIGFIDVAEHAGIYTPTNLPKASGRQGEAIDHILVNGPLAKLIVPGSVHVHEPLVPLDLSGTTEPDQDHKRISVAFRL